MQRQSLNKVCEVGQAIGEIAEQRQCKVAAGCHQAKQVISPQGAQRCRGKRYNVCRVRAPGLEYGGRVERLAGSETHQNLLPAFGRDPVDPYGTGEDEVGGRAVVILK